MSWQDYIRIFGKDKIEHVVCTKKNRDHLRELIPHLKGRALSGKEREFLEFAMEEMVKDGWINGKAGKGKHDFPNIVFSWNRVSEFFDKACGVTVDD